MAVVEVNISYQHCADPAKFGQYSLSLTDNAGQTLDVELKFNFDDLWRIAINPGEASLDDDYVVFDIETTGFSPEKNNIIEIGAVKVTNGEIVDRFSEFVNPEVPIPFEIEKLTSINDEMVKDAETIETLLPRFLEFIGDAALVAHNANFDVSFIR